MKVHELIAILQTFPQDAEMAVHYKTETDYTVDDIVTILEKEDLDFDEILMYDGANGPTVTEAVIINKY